MERILSIDVMRSIAIFFMIVCHFVVFWSGGEENPFLYFLGNHVIGDFAAPLFLFLVGLSQAISQHKRIQKGFSLAPGIVRGLFVFLVGLLVSVGIWGGSALWDWDILTLIGFSLVVITFLYKTPSWVIGVLSLLILFLSPWARSWGNFEAAWPGGFEPVGWISDYFSGIMMDPAEEYEFQGGMLSILWGFLSEAFFPVFPWLSFPLMGFVVGKGYLEKKTWCSPQIMLLLGLCLMILGFLGGYLGRDDGFSPTSSWFISPLSFYPCSITMFFWQLGFCFVLFGKLRYFVDEKKIFGKRITSYCETTSRYSLTYYILHHMVLIWPLWILGWINGGSYEDYYEGFVSEPLSLGLGILFMVLCAPLFYFWDKIKGVGSFEWFLNKGTSFILRK